MEIFKILRNQTIYLLSERFQEFLVERGVCFFRL